MMKFALATAVACLLAAGSAAAQTTPTPPTTPTTPTPATPATTAAPPPVSAFSDAPRTTEQSSRRSSSRQRQQQQPAAPSPEQIAAEAQALAAVAAPNCQMTESALLGARPDGVKIYEVACATGPGYILEAAAEAPKANDCVLQWSYGQLSRERDPAADVGLQCGLPGNQNAVQVIAAYGAQAGVQCDVDQAVAVNVSTYELGCATRDGWLLEQRDGSWKATACWHFATATESTCRYSTEAESRAEWPKLVVGTDAAACAIEDVAWMGDNAERGSFYELKCASGEGIIVRFKDGAGQQTYSCIDAPQIFNKPCTLTPSAAPAAAPAPTGGRA